MSHNSKEWAVLFHPEFDEEFQCLSKSARVGIAAQANILAMFGPALGRPDVDTLKGSKHANMKELRLHADGGVWRVAFAFDPKRQAILLVAGNKAGANQKKFYDQLIRVADKRFERWLKNNGKDSG